MEIDGEARSDAASELGREAPARLDASPAVGRRGRHGMTRRRQGRTSTRSNTRRATKRHCWRERRRRGPPVHCLRRPPDHELNSALGILGICVPASCGSVDDGAPVWRRAALRWPSACGSSSISPCVRSPELQGFEIIGSGLQGGIPKRNEKHMGPGLLPSLSLSSTGL